MKQRIQIGPFVIDGVYDTEDVATAKAATARIKARMEHIEAGIAEAVMREIRIALPELTVEVSHIEDQDL